MNKEDVLAAVQQYIASAGDWLIASGLRILLILLLMVVALRAARVLARFLVKPLAAEDDVEFAKRRDTLSYVLTVALRVVVYVVSLMMILGELGINLGPIIATAGIASLAIGFGAQELVRDVISGFFILLENQVRVGDVVDLDGKSGLVEKVTLRTVVLRDLAGNVHYIRSGNINVITNMTKDYSRYVFNIGISYNNDVDETIKLVREVDEEMRKDEEFRDDILEPMEILGVDSFGDSAVVIKARTKTQPIRQWAVGREFNRRLKYKFDAAGIEIPFPHRTVYLRTEAGAERPAFGLYRAPAGNVDEPAAGDSSAAAENNA